MRPSYDDPDETCDEGEPDDSYALHLNPGQVLTWRDGRFVVVNKSEIVATTATCEFKAITAANQAAE